MPHKRAKHGEVEILLEIHLIDANDFFFLCVRGRSKYVKRWS